MCQSIQGYIKSPPGGTFLLNYSDGPYLSESKLHVPVFTRKINSKIPKNDHNIASYRCFKHFNEVNFLTELTNDLETSANDHETVDADMALFSSLIIRQLNKHAPIKNKRVKTKRMPYWFTPDIRQMQKLRDNCKRKKQWTEYKKYRNKTRQLIRASKRKHFSESISKSKDTKHIWAHLRTLNDDSKASNNRLPE